jgi:hypothetical protein
MISILEKFDKIAAAGILARTALSLGYAASPAAASAIPNEEQVRATIISEARNHLGLMPDDHEADTIEKIADYLDAESDKLISPPDVPSALKRLAERGDLPSDLYEIKVNANTQRIYGKGFPLEKKIIQTTVRAPTLEQHYGTGRPGEPELVSLFAKSFRTTWPMRDFVMLVAAQRKGTELDVNQAWRIYTSRVDVNGISKPIDWLKRFTDVYGAEIEVNGKRAKFFYYADIIRPLEAIAELGGKGKPRQVVISDFTSWKDGKAVASLITAIDADKYRATLKALGVREQDILEPLV